MTKKALVREVEGRHPGARRLLVDGDVEGEMGRRSRSVAVEAQDGTEGVEGGNRNVVQGVGAEGVLVWGVERGVFGVVESSGEVSRRVLCFPFFAAIILPISVLLTIDCFSAPSSVVLLQRFFRPRLRPCCAPDKPHATTEQEERNDEV